MKNYRDYEKEYDRVIYDSLQKSGHANDMIIDKDVYIAMKWQIENNWNPWDKDTEERLTKLYEFDEKLFWAVSEGTKKTIRVVEGKMNRTSMYHKWINT